MKSIQWSLLFTWFIVMAMSPIAANAALPSPVGLDTDAAKHLTVREEKKAGQVRFLVAKIRGRESVGERKRKESGTGTEKKAGQVRFLVAKIRGRESVGERKRGWGQSCSARTLRQAFLS
ncbi:MAG: hypothetical protein WC058_16140 [Phycisphaeraceae bacterium]